MYWLCASCCETYYSSAGIAVRGEWPCEVCGAVTGARFEHDPEVASPATMLVDGEGRVLALSHEMQALTGLSDLEAIGLPWRELAGTFGSTAATFRERETLSGTHLVECQLAKAT